MTKVPQPPAPGTAEHPCLALANSIVTLPGGQRVDELNTPENATAWLITQDLAPVGTGLLAYCQLQLPDLRRNVRGVLGSHTEGLAPEPEALAAINRALTAVASADLLEYAPGEGLFRVPSHPTTRLVDHAMAQVAEDVAAMLTGPDAARIGTVRSIHGSNARTAAVVLGALRRQASGQPRLCPEIGQVSRRMTRAVLTQMRGMRHWGSRH